MESHQIKVAVLEQKIEDLKPIVLRIDKAIEKLSEVNTTVSRMLAVHEERISKQEQVDVVLFTKIDQLRDKMDGDHDMVLQRIRELEKRVWMAVGGLAVLTIGLKVMTAFPNVLTNTPVVSTMVRTVSR
jgi:DNA-binding ferritin-like protein